MKPLLATALCLLVICELLAAPAPPVFFKPGWDDPIDPDKDCKFRQTEDKLTIEIPGKAHDWDNAPRLLRDVKGDFRAEVRVSGEWSLSAESTIPKKPCSVSGGLLILREGDQEEFINTKKILQEFGITDEKDPPLDLRGPFAYLTWTARVYMVRDTWPKQMHFRFERRADVLRFFYSVDGKKWTDWGENARMSMDLPRDAKVKVGLIAFSTSKESCKVHFDQFNITALPKEP